MRDTLRNVPNISSLNYLLHYTLVYYEYIVHNKGRPLECVNGEERSSRNAGVHTCSPIMSKSTATACHESFSRVRVASRVDLCPFDRFVVREQRPEFVNKTGVRAESFRKKGCVNDDVRVLST